MKCPVCPDENLTMSERQGIEIDYCPKCRGVWLDRGELDKIIERSEKAQASYARPAPVEDQRGYRGAYDDRGSYDNRGGYGDRRPHHKRRKSLLAELFD